MCQVLTDIFVFFIEALRGIVVAERADGRRQGRQAPLTLSRP